MDEDTTHPRGWVVLSLEEGAQPSGLGKLPFAQSPQGLHLLRQPQGLPEMWLLERAEWVGIGFAFQPLLVQVLEYIVATGSVSATRNGLCRRT